MPVDETKDRVVIHDLEAEIAEIEAAEPPTLFLPDIDRKVVHTTYVDNLIELPENNYAFYAIFYITALQYAVRCFLFCPG